MLRGGKGRYPYHIGKHLIAALHLWAYGDESGIDERAKYCLILGYIAAPLQWQRFNELWKMALKNYEVPEFHSIDFFPRDRQRSSTNPYRGWSDERRIEFYRALRKLGVTPRNAVFVGDNPEADIHGAKAVGMKAIWMEDLYWTIPSNADATITQLCQLPEILETLNTKQAQ